VDERLLELLQYFARSHQDPLAGGCKRPKQSKYYSRPRNGTNNHIDFETFQNTNG